MQIIYFISIFFLFHFNFGNCINIDRLIDNADGLDFHHHHHHHGQHDDDKHEEVFTSTQKIDSVTTSEIEQETTLNKLETIPIEDENVTIEEKITKKQEIQVVKGNYTEESDNEVEDNIKNRKSRGNLINQF